MRKNMYIASGETASFDNLTCKNITVDGELCIKEKLTANIVGGKGFIKAGAIRAKTVRVDILDTDTIVADIVMARQIYATEVRAKESVVASSFIEAKLVKSPKVTLADAEIIDVQADDIVVISAKPHSILGALVLAFIRSTWMSLFGNTAESYRHERVKYVVADSVDDVSADMSNDSRADVSSDVTNNDAGNSTGSGVGNVSWKQGNDIAFDFSNDVSCGEGKADTDTGVFFTDMSIDEPVSNPISSEIQEVLELLQNPNFRQLLSTWKTDRAYGTVRTFKNQPDVIDIYDGEYKGTTDDTAA